MLTLAEILKATSGKLICGNKDSAVSGISTDSRSLKPGEAFLVIKGSNFNAHDFLPQAARKGASCFILTDTAKAARAKGPACIKVKDAVIALGDIARFYRNKFNIPVIAVTGSNGKTTAKEMVAQVLAQKYKVLKNEGTKNNHIGLPQALLGLDKSFDLAVLEISTNHFGEVAYLSGICSPDIGIITNIAPAHLENFKNLQGVFKEKYALINRLKHPHLAVLNSDDNFFKNRTYSQGKKPFCIGFGIKNGGEFSASAIKLKDRGLEFLVNRKYRFTLKTIGEHNIYNALAAISLGRIFGISYNRMIAALAKFNFPKGRLELSGYKKINFINDTYNANPESLRQALGALSNFPSQGRKILVMGDMLELGEGEESWHRQIGKELCGLCDILVAVGRLSQLTAAAAGASGFIRQRIFTCRTSAEARDILWKQIVLEKGDVVLVKGSRAMRMEEVL